MIGTRDTALTIGFLIYPGFNALDLVRPHEVLTRLDVRCLIVAEAACIVP